VISNSFKDAPIQCTETKERNTSTTITTKLQYRPHPPKSVMDAISKNFWGTIPLTVHYRISTFVLLVVPLTTHYYFFIFSLYPDPDAIFEFTTRSRLVNTYCIFRPFRLSLLGLCDITLPCISYIDMDLFGKLQIKSTKISIRETTDNEGSNN